MFNRIKNELQTLVQRGLDNHLRLAVTGLSRSGKTAFITSLVDQLLHSQTANLPLFQAVKSGQIVSVKRIEQGNLTIPRFEYDKNRQCLEDTPARWCDSTRGISEIRLVIRYKRKGISRHLAEENTLYLDIFDYPGEWLLDLPILHQSFKEWCEAQQLVHTGKRAELAKEWLQAVENLDLFTKADENQLANLSEKYTAYLLECKVNEMQYIQPGRFVLPDQNMQGAPVLQFFPLLNLTETDWGKLEKADKNSTYKMLEKRYYHYQQKIVKPFYDHYFSRFDRQVILADCLTPLNHGYHEFMEMKLGLQQLFKHFHYGTRNLFSRLFSAHIDKLLFLATKADHITPEQIPNLESLMRQLVLEGGNHTAFDGIKELGYYAISSIKTTDVVNVTKGGQSFKAVKGVRSNNSSQVSVTYPGSVPSRLPNASYWQYNQFDFDQFEPKHIEYDEPIPHLRMDAVLQFLLADMLD